MGAPHEGPDRARHPDPLGRRERRHRLPQRLGDGGRLLARHSSGAPGSNWPSTVRSSSCAAAKPRRPAVNALEASGLNPDRLTIEITERTINDDRAAADLRALSELGVHLAVDDVGTSWSSLQVLRKFAIEIVKIDRAFINNLEAEEGMNRAIVEAIIHVGHSLAMSTVAEGVESSQQAAILREFGADVGQGYFFAPPFASDEAHQLATAEPRPIFSLGPGRESSASRPRRPAHRRRPVGHPGQ